MVKGVTAKARKTREYPPPPRHGRWNPINSKFLQAELKVLDGGGSFPGMSSIMAQGTDGASPLAKRVPCSLHWREEQERKRLKGSILPPLRPDSPDLTDCAPRGPITFRQKDDT